MVCQFGVSPPSAGSATVIAVNTTAFAATAPVFVSTMPAEWATRARQFLFGAHPLAQLIRFAAVGGASNISYLLLFLGCAGLGPLAANAAGSIVSTMIANELHRRLTFRAAGRIGWFTAQWQGGGLALLGLLTSTAALAGIEFLAPGLDEITRASLVLAVMAAVGGLRFLALRGLF